MKRMIILLSLMLIACRPVSVMTIIDVNTQYPEVDTGIGISYSEVSFVNSDSNVRFGPFIAADVNPTLSRPDWGSLGVFLGKEIQKNVMVGVSSAYKFGDSDGTNGIQWGFFAAVDVIPWLTRK